MDQYIIRTITNELRNVFPGTVVEQMLTLYEGVANLEVPVEKGIKAEWVENIVSFYRLSESMRANHRVLMNSESFFKKLLFVVDEQKYKTCVVDSNLGMYRMMEQVGLLSRIPAYTNLSTCDYTKVSDHVNRAIIQTYQLRNLASHTSREWSISEMLSNVNAVMVATLQAVWINRTVIQKIISKDTSNSQFGIDLFLKKIEKDYNRKIKEGFRYVSLLWESADSEPSQVKAKRICMDELIEDRHILLEGEAGSGKTTSLDYLEYQAAKSYLSGSSDMIPVKIQMNEEIPDHSIQEMICRKLNIPASYCDTMLEKNLIYLLIDGLNELTLDMEKKRTFVISLERFMMRYPDVFIAATDRRFSQIPIRVNKTYHLKRMEKQDILDYAKSREECDKRTLELLTQVLNEPAFEGLEYTPLMVNQLLVALSAKGEIPSDLAELVGVYLEALLKREYEQKRDLNAAPGKLDILLMKFAMEDVDEEGIPVIRAMKICADTAREYCLNIQSDACIGLAVQLGILKRNNRYIDFVLDEYRTYYLLQAIDRGL